MSELLKYLTCILLSIALVSCGSDEETDVCLRSGAPNITSIESVVGASSVDFTITVSGPSKLYYIISKSSISGNSEELIQSIKNGSLGNEVSESGTVEISCDLIAESVLSVSALSPETNFFAYFIAESSIDQSSETQPTQSTFETKKKFQTIPFTSNLKGKESSFMIYFPEERLKFGARNTNRPLLIFLGSDEEVAAAGQFNVFGNGSVFEYLNAGNDIPFITVAPEHESATWDIDFVKEVVEEVKSAYLIDEFKIYMTGMDEGGTATWEYALKYHNDLAALVPISSLAIDNLQEVVFFTNEAIWHFHNEVDNIVPATSAIDFVQHIKTGVQPPTTKDVRITLFADEGHNAWKRVYNPNHEDWSKDESIAPVDIYEWMLQQ